MKSQSLSGTGAGANAARTFSVEMTGCGSAVVTVDGNGSDISLDRCTSL
jgi:hypothetical protein